MKFIDLYNRNKDCSDFKYRVQMFKTYCYLMKNNPLEYKVEFDKKKEYFIYFQAAKDYFEGGYVWKIKDDSNGRYKSMGDYERKY